MSIEALPNELLVKIFSFCTLVRDLLPLSLVNRRWNQVIGQMATLRVSKSIYIRQQESSRKSLYPKIAIICIPLEVLCGSSREYRKFSCSLVSSEFEISEAFGSVLEYCHQTWNMNALHMDASYELFLLFLQQYKNLLNDVVRAHIEVHDSRHEYRSEGFFSNIPTHLVVPVGKLQRLNLNIEAFSLFSPCSLSFHAPNLKFLKISRCPALNRENTLHFTFQGSTNLRSVYCSDYEHKTRSDLVAVLEDILPQAPKITRIELYGFSIASIFRATFGHIHTIILAHVTITPTDDPLECLNLTNLQLHGVTLNKPLNLRVPELHTLICDSQTLQSICLQDAFKADLIETDLFFEELTTFPEGLSSFRRLHLKLESIDGEDDTSNNWLWPGITELKLQGLYGRRYFHLLRNICKHFPQLNALRLLAMEVPDNFNFLPAHVKNVSIECCPTTESSIEFPPSVEAVRINKLWVKAVEPSRAEMILLPPNQYMPLESEIIRVERYYQMLLRMSYSTKDCHKLYAGMRDVYRKYLYES